MRNSTRSLTLLGLLTLIAGSLISTSLTAQQEPAAQQEPTAQQDPGATAPADAGDTAPEAPAGDAKPEATPQGEPAPGDSGATAPQGEGSSTQTPATTADAQTTEAGGDPPDPEDEAAKAKAPRRFIPSEKSTADNSTTFPVDI
jgi:hypothetical protein